MNLFQVKQFVKQCSESLDAVKQDFSVAEQKVLDQAYLVVCFGGKQLELSELSPESLGRNHSGLLVNSSSKDWLMRLARRKAWLEAQKEKIEKEIASAKYQLARANENWIQLKDFTVELRFNQIDYGMIQKLKRSPIADKDKTDMSRASIRVILQPNKGKEQQHENL